MFTFHLQKCGPSEGWALAHLWSSLAMKKITFKSKNCLSTLPHHKLHVFSPSTTFTSLRTTHTLCFKIFIHLKLSKIECLYCTWMRLGEILNILMNAKCITLILIAPGSCVYATKLSCKTKIKAVNIKEAFSINPVSSHCSQKFYFNYIQGVILRMSKNQFH